MQKTNKCIRSGLLATLLTIVSLGSQGQFRPEITTGIQMASPFNVMGGKVVSSLDKAKYRFSPIAGIYAEIPLNRYIGIRTTWNTGLFNYRQAYADDYSPRTYLRATVMEWDLQGMYKGRLLDVYIGFKINSFYGVKRYNWIEGKKTIIAHPDIHNSRVAITGGITYRFLARLGVFLQFDFDLSGFDEVYFEGVGRDLKFEGVRAGVQYRLARIPLRKFYHSVKDR